MKDDNFADQQVTNTEDKWHPLGPKKLEPDTSHEYQDPTLIDRKPEKPSHVGMQRRGHAGHR